MKFDFNMRSRRSIRLKGHDYSAPGDYFITVCMMNMECVLGKIREGKMELSESGGIIRKEWLNTEKVRPSIRLGPFIIMPNHMHGIITIHCRRGDPLGRPGGDQPVFRASQRDAPTKNPSIGLNTPRRGDALGRPDLVHDFGRGIRAFYPLRASHRDAPTLEPATIGAIIGQFKSLSTKKIRATDLIGFHWQRNYYEHIIRNKSELEQVRKYILENPLKWPEDPDNPINQ